MSLNSLKTYVYSEENMRESGTRIDRIKSIGSVATRTHVCKRYIYSVALPEGTGLPAAPHSL